MNRRTTVEHAHGQACGVGVLLTTPQERLETQDGGCGLDAFLRWSDTRVRGSDTLILIRSTKSDAQKHVFEGKFHVFEGKNHVFEPFFMFLRAKTHDL